MLEGSCLCGGVAYECGDLVDPIGHCQCGTHLMAEWEDQDTVILRLGALDTDPGEVPVGHIWVSHAVPWLAYGPDLPMYPEGIPQRGASK